VSYSPGWVDHILVLILAVIFPVRAGFFGFRRLQRASAEDLPRVKRAFYRNALIVQWVLVAALVALWLATGRRWSGLGLVPHFGGGLVGVLIGIVIILVVMLRQGRVHPVDERALERLRQQTRHLARMLPATLPERSWFFALAATAGVCEESLYRGYMIWYLSACFLALPVVHPVSGFLDAHLFLVAAIASSLIFGFGHVYQGPRGILLTAAVGGFLAAVYWITRSLYAGMLIHALMDMHAGYVGHLAYSCERRAAPGEDVLPPAPDAGSDPEADGLPLTP
jgi:membrane protease YdiL (CAAX protease family)